MASKKGRTVHRKITDYFSMLLLLPLLLFYRVYINLYHLYCSKIENFALLAPLLNLWFASFHFLSHGLCLQGYICLCLTHVLNKTRFNSWYLAGTVFQVFQYLYINGQIWVTKYNAIYGSFAAIPLLLLWLQMSWTICLFGAQLSYTSQNIAHFDFDKDTKNISRRYKDFISVLVWH